MYSTKHDIAQDDDGRPVIVLNVGDYDPSGLFMSEVDIPNRLRKYKGGHVKLRRIALIPKQTRGLLPFPASDKKKDPRSGKKCWELDAMDPRVLRHCAEREIKLIEPEAWRRCERVNQAEKDNATNRARVASRAQHRRGRMTTWLIWGYNPRQDLAGCIIVDAKETEDHTEIAKGIVGSEFVVHYSQPIHDVRVPKGWKGVLLREDDLYRRLPQLKTRHFVIAHTEEDIRRSPPKNNKAAKR